jgi:hypothetical protein
MASTGFILAAMEAGIIPETTPKIIQIYAYSYIPIY